MGEDNRSRDQWDKTEDWFWEGNVQSRIVDYMKVSEGFTTIKAADTLSKEHGPDIDAEKNGKRRFVYVKGYPSVNYVDGDRRGQEKKTSPSTQSKHWYGQALRDAILAKGDNPGVEIGLGFPDFTRYRELIRRSTWALEKLRFYCYLVDESGKVTLIRPSVSNSSSSSG